MNIFDILLRQPIANGIIVFYKIFGQNMGLAIIGFSLFLRFILNPLTKPYMDSMKKMKEYSKDLEKLKNKHKGDRSKQMQAQAQFYKDKKINPSAGCIPYLIQIAILIAMFNVFSTVLGNGDIVGEFNKLLYEPLKFASGERVETTFLYLDITKPDVIKLPGLPFPIPGLLLILAAVTQFVSAKIATPYIAQEEKIAKKTKEKSDDFQVAMQSSMVWTFPLITLVAGMQFPSGLALYWFLFSFYQAYQQYKTYGWGGARSLFEKLNLKGFIKN